MRFKIFALPLIAAGIYCSVTQAKPTADSAQRAMSGLVTAVRKNNVKGVFRYIPKSGLKIKDNLMSPPTYVTWRPETKDGRANIKSMLIDDHDDIDAGLGDSLRKDKWIRIGPNRFTFKEGRPKVMYIQWKKNAGKWFITEIGYPYRSAG